ncbi:MAG: transcriptional regulator [Candidatus Bathyarchaeota archaeon]|nr:transcriptional regulator [Candidatus Bathyarchaeota archaeon]
MTKEERNIIDLLKKINDNLISLNSKIDNFIQTQEPEEKSISLEGIPLDVATLLSLPDHLRKTAMTICELKEATASDVAEKTGRVRAAESDYLNQLVSHGHIKKKRKGHDVYFYISEE